MKERGLDPKPHCQTIYFAESEVKREQRTVNREQKVKVGKRMLGMAAGVGRGAVRGRHPAARQRAARRLCAQHAAARQDAVGGLPRSD